MSPAALPTVARSAKQRRLSSQGAKPNEHAAGQIGRLSKLPHTYHSQEAKLSGMLELYSTSRRSACSVREATARRPETQAREVGGLEFRSQEQLAILLAKTTY